MKGLLFTGLLIRGGAYVALMPAVQTTYTENMRPAVEGLRANMEPAVMISRNVEDAAGIGFGKVVMQGVRDDGCTAVLTGFDADKYLGITVREGSVRPATPNAFGQYESARIMRKGVIWVAVAGAVTAGTDVTVTTATGVLGSAAVGAGVVAIPGARWESSTTGAGLAKVRLG